MRIILEGGAIFYNHKWRVQGGLLQDLQDIVRTGYTGKNNVCPKGAKIYEYQKRKKLDSHPGRNYRVVIRASVCRA